MTHKSPAIVEWFEYDGKKYRMEFYRIKNKNDIPKLPWGQIYAVGNYSGKVPVVKYEAHKDNLPGGGVEAGESLEDAIDRELREEINMSIVDWEPLGYQKNISETDGEVSYQFRIYAKLKKIGEFHEDLGGVVIGYHLVDIDDLNTAIQWGQLGDWFVNNLRNKYR